MAGALTSFTSGTKAKASEVNTNLERSYYMGSLAGTASYGAVTASTTAQQVRASTSTRVGMLVFNNSSASVFVGTSAVTASNGKTLLTQKSIYIQDTEAVYAITSSGTADLRYIEVTNA